MRGEVFAAIYSGLVTSIFVYCILRKILLWPFHHLCFYSTWDTAEQVRVYRIALRRDNGGWEWWSPSDWYLSSRFDRGFKAVQEGASSLTRDTLMLWVVHQISFQEKVGAFSVRIVERVVVEEEGGRLSISDRVVATISRERIRQIASKVDSR